jgi:1,4-dihydroxy-2-naphthoate octaprenyltransferase
MLNRWLEIIRTCNLPEDMKMAEADVVSKWLVITRACVFSMTLTAGIIGGLLALSEGAINWWFWLVAIVGIIVAHASNNMINDYYDYQFGTDTSDEYPRGLYSPHPIHSGWVTSSRLMLGILILNFIDLIIMIYLMVQVGWQILLFALIGLFISVFYVAESV